MNCLLQLVAGASRSAAAAITCAVQARVEHLDAEGRGVATAEQVSVFSCSFCGKTQDRVKKLVAGPDVYICDGCVDLCNEIILGELESEE